MSTCPPVVWHRTTSTTSWSRPPREDPRSPGEMRPLSLVLQYAAGDHPAPSHLGEPRPASVVRRAPSGEAPGRRWTLATLPSSWPTVPQIALSLGETSRSLLMLRLREVSGAGRLPQTPIRHRAEDRPIPGAPRQPLVSPAVSLPCLGDQPAMYFDGHLTITL